MEFNLREKINQLFILGYSGENFKNNIYFTELLKQNLGGVIFFTQNIVSETQFKNQISELKKTAKTPLFLSIDEEGGRVERFENINKDCPDCKKYLSAKYIVQKGDDKLIEQTQKISDELNDFGLNMNFAPVLDVNSNPENPIIGERAYSDNPEDVSKYALLVNAVYRKNGIITVGKHFPGHGDTKQDSHLEMPSVDIDFENFEKIHIYPFKKAIEEDIPAIMVAHVHYKCFDNEPVPASVSKNVLNYLRNDLKYDGLVVSDDMEMGGIKPLSPICAVTNALKNGVNCFIYRNCNENVMSLLNELKHLAEKDEELLTAINNSCSKITELKNKYNLCN